MGKSLTRKILESHAVEGEWIPGDSLAVRVHQVLTHDLLGPLVFLQFAALGLPRFKVELAATYADHSVFQTDPRMTRDHHFIRTASRKFGAYYSRPGAGICHQDPAGELMGIMALEPGEPDPDEQLTGLRARGRRVCAPEERTQHHVLFGALPRKEHILLEQIGAVAVEPVERPSEDLDDPGVGGAMTVYCSPSGDVNRFVTLMKLTAAWASRMLGRRATPLRSGRCAQAPRSP